MFDGFDEISSPLQEKAIQLMKDITAKKSAQLFVTTRPHMIDQLQFRLSQLAYSLEKLHRTRSNWLSFRVLGDESERVDNRK